MTVEANQNYETFKVVSDTPTVVNDAPTFDATS